MGRALRVREAALRTARGGGGAGTLLAELSGVVAHDHASLTQWDPLRRRHTTLASTYPDGANAYIERRLHEDPGFASVLRSPAGPAGGTTYRIPSGGCRRDGGTRWSRWACGTVSPSACSPRTAGTSAC